jgi:replicative DNA helicase
MNHPESVLFAHLTSADSLDYLVKEGFTAEANREVIPTELARDVVGWVLEFYFKAGRTVAPTRDGILETWGEAMADRELKIEDEYETDSIEWAVAELRSQFATVQTQQFGIRLGNDVFNAAPPDKVAVVKHMAGELHALASQLTSHHQEVPLDIGLDEAWVQYQERATARNHVSGLTFGLDEIDHHTMGVKDGELAIFAGFAGSGKSWMSGKCALSEWRRGRQTVLITLENTVDMTIDRMACMMAGIAYEKWQRGTVDEGGLIRFHTMRQRIQETEHAPVVIQPDAGDRSPVALIHRARVCGAESVIIDQVSHVEAVQGSRSYKRNETVAEVIREFKSLISEGREKLPLLLLAQIKREGQANARKTGRYVMDDLAESSEIERTADFVFSVIRQITETNEDGALWQTLKARRVQPKDWEMTWRLGVGDLRVQREVAA